MSPSSSIPPTQCKCRLPLMTLTSWTCSNPARRFGVFRNKYKTGIKQCRDLELVCSRVRDNGTVTFVRDASAFSNPSQVKNRK
ncbi:hypothetical protein Tco_1515883 [Tanacetum coccineum]